MMDKFPVLETERLYLTSIDHRYVDDLFDILSRDEVTEYYGTESLEHIDEAKEIINQIDLLYRQRRSIRWGIVLKENGKFIGTVGLNHMQLLNKKAEIGYELHPDHWRKGYTIEAVRKVLHYAFYHLDLYRIGAVTYPQNVASNRLLKKIGFKEEGILRGYLYQNNQSHDAIMHSLLKKEWEESPLRIEKKIYKSSATSIPQWMILAKEIDELKKEIMQLNGWSKRKKIRILNKKIKAYNNYCPSSLPKRTTVK